MARLKEKIVNCLEESGKNFQLTLDYICTLVKILKSIQKTSHTMFNIHFMTSDFPKLVNEQLKTENSLIFRYQVKILHSIEQFPNINVDLCFRGTDTIPIFPIAKLQLNHHKFKFRHVKLYKIIYS